MAGFLRYLRLVVEHKILLPILLLAKKLAGTPKDGLRVNIGGGYFCRPGWTCLDYKTGSYPYKLDYVDFNVNLMTHDPLPFADGSVRYFYSAHTLEHIPQEYCDHIFAELYRCLAPGGVVRLSMPDFDILYDAYFRRDMEVFKYQRYKLDQIEWAFLRAFATGMAGQTPLEEVRADLQSLSKDDFADKYTGLVPRETQIANGGNHINWFNYPKLERMLKAAGFTQVIRTGPQGSQVPEMRGEGNFLGLEHVVSLGRIVGFDTGHPQWSVFAEAVKTPAGKSGAPA